MTRQATYPGNNLTTNRTTVILKFAKNLQDVCTYGESWYKVGMNGKMEFVICVSSHMTPKATYPGNNLTTKCTAVILKFAKNGESLYKVGMNGKRGFVICVSSHMTPKATYPGNNLTTNCTAVILKFAKNLQDVYPFFNFFCFLRVLSC